MNPVPVESPKYSLAGVSSDPMSHSQSKTLAAARALLSHPLSFEEFLAKLPPKDRLNAERRVTVLDAGADQQSAQLWRRLACSLMNLAPFAAKLVGRQTLQVYIADGKFRMQVFALEDLRDGVFTIYCPDVLDEAQQTGIVAPASTVEPDKYEIEPSKQVLVIKRLDSRSPNPAPHFKDLTGWNRKALRITLPPSASPAQIEAAELICAIAAQHFARPASPAVEPRRR